MAAAEDVLPLPVAPVVEDDQRQIRTRLSDIDLASRKAEEAAMRRYEAAEWLRKTVGVVGAKDLPAEPSEEDLRLGLRSGRILCNVLNKIEPEAVPKVVESPCDSSVVPDGGALSVFQYFENVRNFLVAVGELGLPTFEASDLEKGGKSARIVDCVLALKSYNDWKQGGSNGLWKFGGNVKPPGPGKPFTRRNSEPFMNSFSRTQSLGEKFMDALSHEQLSYADMGSDLSEMGTSSSLNMLVRSILLDKKLDDIPYVVESMLSKIMEEFENWMMISQNKRVKTTPKDASESSPVKFYLECDVSESCPNEFLLETASKEIKFEVTTSPRRDEESDSESHIHDEGLKPNPDEPRPQEPMPDSDELQPQEPKSQRLLKWEILVEQQQRDLMELKHTLHLTKVDIQSMQMKYKEEFNKLGKQLHGLAHAASKYHGVFDENRKLYNQLQDLKGSIRVYCRVRPFLSGQENRVSCMDVLDNGKLSIIIPSKNGKDGRKSFSFNKVFGPSGTQAEVFSDTQPLIRSVLDGYNVCIFAYGQTGSGKTYTMTGPKELTEEGLGVNYRALSDLFQLSERRRDTVLYEISVQMIEIYNEQVRDLLSSDDNNKRLEIRNSSQNGINVPDAHIVPVSSTSDVITLMTLGHKNRAVSSTALNDRSSRSHSCLTVHVQGKNLTSGNTLRGCMHLVDLAGSERVDKADVVGDRLKEAQHINKSLSALGDVIAALAHKNSHVPYRNSKLTQLLQDSLGGQAKTLMFVHISPEPDALGETLSTLKFAERVSTVELGAAQANKDSNADARDLKEQIAGLKAALARKGSEPGHLQRSRSSSPDRLRMLSGEDSSHPSSEVQISASKPRRQSLDPQDLLGNSTSWDIIGSPRLNCQVGEKERGVGAWIDKVMVNKVDNAGSLECLEEGSVQLPIISYQRHVPDPSKVYLEQPHNRLLRKDNRDFEVQRNLYETVSDDSGDLETVTSGSSETDFINQRSPSKNANIPNGFGSKTRNTNLKPAKGEIRSAIPTLGASPSSSRKIPNGLSPPLSRVKRPVAVDAKRKTVNRK